MTVSIYRVWLLVLLVLVLSPLVAIAQEAEEDVADESMDVEAVEEEEGEDASKIRAGTFTTLRARLIGPALMSGRISDLAVDPDNYARYFVAVASGGVWKTTNAGTTWKPVFDRQGSYSIGCVTMDPNNPHTIWVGTGENNSQRSVGFGDGVYRSRDGGETWQNVGLHESEHIGMITVDPRDSDVVYVAAQGPLWRSGGDRGVYKTTDGGNTWERVLHVSDDTGANEVHIDPRDPDTLYASTYQRRRHTWTLINGGPECSIYKSTDGGESWRKITRGLPGVDLGRIGMDISPANPDVIYAIVEAAQGKGGFYRSTNRGESWQRMNSYMTTSPQYYNEVFCDPVDVDRVYLVDTIMRVTEDGGRTIRRAPRQYRHVDDHALWINPDNTDHMIVGCDGGVYDTYDGGGAWHFKDNLPITQFYRVTADNSTPFYYVYGGTQDNSTQGGPSRTTSPAGIANEDWFITVGGDGFKTVIDPEDPMIVYSQWQHGGLIRHDRRSGQRVDIKPKEDVGDEPLRWNWDSPIIISPHDPHRLYFAANILFCSDDRGDGWRAVSGDLSRQLDRNQLEILGRIQPPDAVSKHWNTSFYGNIVSLDESPLVEGLLYVGTDDGLVQVSEDGGESWRREATFPDVPEMSYVSFLKASAHDPDVVFAGFDNHKQGDFNPYILRSDDRGRTWTSIAGDLPERNFVRCFQEDHVRPGLLFVGTEFSAYFTIDGGEKWMKVGGLPTIAVRDLDIQERENDLVIGTFGRGIYIVDDYTPLRHVSEERLEEEAIIFPIKDALRYQPTSRLGGSGRGSQGASFYLAENPPFGAVFTYYLKDKFKTSRELRHEAEREAEKAGEPTPYPTLDELRAEDEEKSPQVFLTITDDAGEVVRRIRASRSGGMHRASWDLRYPGVNPIFGGVDEDVEEEWREPAGGAMALPGTYTVTMAREINGEITHLAGPTPFDVVPLELSTFESENRAEVLAFQRKVGRLHRAIQGALRAAGEANTRIGALETALAATPDADPAIIAELRSLDARMDAVLLELRGDRTRGRRWEPARMSVSERVSQVWSNQRNVTSPPTQTQEREYERAAAAFEPLLAELRDLIEHDLPDIEQRLEEAGAPWTPGRVPSWTRE
jgi:photosystem II stability/assembly factor-like uncharacterized protein